MCGVVGEAIIKSEPPNSTNPSSSSTSLLTLPSGASISLLNSSSNSSLSPNNPRKHLPADCCNDNAENGAILRVMTSPIQDGGDHVGGGKDMLSLSLIPSAPPSLLIPSLLSSVVSSASLISGNQHQGNIFMLMVAKLLYNSEME